MLLRATLLRDIANGCGTQAALNCGGECGKESKRRQVWFIEKAGQLAESSVRATQMAL
jgi:hypothetical protein